MATLKISAPFDNLDPWTLAGANSDGIVFVAKVRSRHIDLWAYNSINKRWKLIASADWPLRSSVPHRAALISATFNQAIDQVAVFVSTAVYVFIFRFETGPPARLHSVLALSGRLLFHNMIRPSIQFVGDRLVVAGAKAENTFLRLFRVDVNDALNTFTLTQMWVSEPAYEFAGTRTAAIGDKLILLRYHEVLVFRPNFEQGIREWKETVTSFPWPMPTDYASYRDEVVNLCSSPVWPDRVWFVTLFEEAAEAVLLNGRLSKTRSVEWESREDMPCTNSGHAQTTAVSKFHFFWMHEDGDEYEIKTSAPLAVPNLQQSCLDYLCKWSPAVRECNDESKAIQLGIPVPAWRRYFPYESRK